MTKYLENLSLFLLLIILVMLMTFDSISNVNLEILGIATSILLMDLRNTNRWQFSVKSLPSVIFLIAGLGVIKFDKIQDIASWVYITLCVIIALIEMYLCYVRTKKSAQIIQP